VAREPFKVHAWVDRGYYRVGEVIEGHFAARRLDGKPVQGNAELKLYKIAYDKDSKPVETVAQEWTLATGEDGLALQQMKASEPGSTASPAPSPTRRDTVSKALTSSPSGGKGLTEGIPVQRGRTGDGQARVRARREGPTGHQHQPGQRDRSALHPPG
jgi:hypothetical protein